MSSADRLLGSYDIRLLSGLQRNQLSPVRPPWSVKLGLEFDLAVTRSCSREVSTAATMAAVGMSTLQ